MDVFRKNYSVYCSVLSLAGLWPYDESLVGKIQRVVVSSLILSCIVVQISSLQFVEASLYNIVTLLSYSFPMFLYFLRYIGFVVNFPVIRSLFENVGKDCATLESSVEVEMLMKHMADARRVILAYIALPSIVAVYVCATILIPTLLHSKLQLHYMHMFGFFYNEQGSKTDWVCAYLVLVCVLGQITIAGTESSLAVFSAYLCGLFDIASYRIENAVNKMVNSVTLDLIDVQPAVQIHQRAIELFLLATEDLSELENLAFSWNLVVSHIIIMFLNNHSGQKLITTSIEFFNQTYNTLWYCIPPKSQKVLLFVLMRSMSEVQFDLAGLFTPCYEGFSMMMSSSFSYFTVLYSI